jgi:hypothetical protein
MGGGGGGSPAPSTTYSQTSNIPDYAKPYVETMLGTTQKQLYTTDDSGVTGFQEYKPYSTNMNDYVAGFSPLQQQAQQGAYGLQVPGQYDQAGRMTGMAGRGSLGLAGQMAGAGQQYAMGATDPRTTQAYMSPYMQNVVDYQKSQALRDYQMSQPAMQAKAVGQGAFGGNRLALQQSEAQRGLMSQLQGIEATGAQSAFQNAQQAQQYGANLGLQGQQGALQGLGQYGQMAGQLGQLGTAQLAAQQGIIGTQAQQGALQQAQEQTKINQAIQDYATQQQYPLMQLGFMSNMLRGLPMQAQTTQMYQAQPSTLQQGIGLVGAGASLFGAQGKAGGGEIKEMAEGGIAGYKYGGAIPEAKLAGMADNLSVPQLVERMKDPSLTEGERDVFKEALAAKQQTAARSQGIAAAGGGLFDTMGYAGGGILAFEDGGEVEHFDQGGSAKDRSAFKQDLMDLLGIETYSDARNAPPEVPEWMKKTGDYFTKPREKKTMSPSDLENLAASKGVFAEGSAALSEGTNKPAPGPAGPSAGATGSQGSGSSGNAGGVDGKGLKSILQQIREGGPEGQLGTNRLSEIDALAAGADKRFTRADKLAMAKGFLKFGSTAAPGGIGQAAIAGLGDYAEGYGKALESDEKFKEELSKQKSDIQNLRRAEERGDVKLAAELQDKIADRANRLQTANISAAASGRARAGDDAYVKQLMSQGMSLEQALQAVKGAGKAESNDITRVKTALAELNGQLTFLNKNDPRRAKIEEQIGALTQMLTTGIGTQTASAGVPKDIQGILSKYQ